MKIKDLTCGDKILIKEYDTGYKYITYYRGIFDKYNVWIDCPSEPTGNKKILNSQVISKFKTVKEEIEIPIEQEKESFIYEYLCPQCHKFWGKLMIVGGFPVVSNYCDKCVESWSKKEDKIEKPDKIFNINNLKIGDKIKYKIDDITYLGLIAMMTNDKVRISSVSEILWIRKDQIVSIIKEEEIKVVQEKPTTKSYKFDFYPRTATCYYNNGIYKTCCKMTGHSDFANDRFEDNITLPYFDGMDFYTNKVYTVEIKEK